MIWSSCQQASLSILATFWDTRLVDSSIFLGTESRILTRGTHAGSLPRGFLGLLSTLPVVGEKRKNLEMCHATYWGPGFRGMECTQPPPAGKRKEEETWKQRASVWGTASTCVIVKASWCSVKCYALGLKTCIWTWGWHLLATSAEQVYSSPSDPIGPSTKWGWRTYITELLWDKCDSLGDSV
jgi:hypothetical protein